MSAWIVSKAHIDTLVQSLINEGVIHPSSATATGRLLWQECPRSVAYRYPSDTDGNRPGPVGFHDIDVVEYEFEGTDQPLDDWVVYANVNCYDYQSCEHPEWRGSEAESLCERLRDRIVDRIGPTVPYNDPRYDKAPWGIDAISQAVAS